MTPSKNPPTGSHRLLPSTQCLRTLWLGGGGKLFSDIDWPRHDSHTSRSERLECPCGTSRRRSIDSTLCPPCSAHSALRPVQQLPLMVTKEARVHGRSLGGRLSTLPSMCWALSTFCSMPSALASSATHPTALFLYCGAQAAFSPRPGAPLSFLQPHHKTVTCLGSGYSVQLGHSTLLASSTPP